MPKRVTIGIQARSTSHRLPGKVLTSINGKTVLSRVIYSCNEARRYINNYNTKRIFVDIGLCVPKDDPIVRKKFENITVVEGSEDDVLSRYTTLASLCESDFIVRITADCPMIPSFIISKCITLAAMNSYDYISNVDERCRTSIDGMDCEVISKRLLDHIGKEAVTPHDKEHVTTLIRSNPPPWAKMGTVINFVDLSQMKLSIDTDEDLVRVTEEVSKIDNALNVAESIFGRNHVHRV